MRRFPRVRPVERTLANFVKALRNAEVHVSPAETLDAMEVMRLIGMRDRETLKHSLCLALAKTPLVSTIFTEQESDDDGQLGEFGVGKLLPDIDET